MLARYRAPRLAHLDRATGRCVRRYERGHPGALVHVDVKKLGAIPDGGGYRAPAYFTHVGISLQRVLTDNHQSYRSAPFRAAAAATGTAHKRTRAYRPQAGGKVERFHRTETERRDAFDTWIHGYRHHRGHTALGGHPPASRVTNLTGEYT